MPKQIGTLGTIETLTVAGRVFTDLTNLIVLFGSGNTGATFATLRLSTTGAGYQVPGGMTLSFKAGVLTNATDGVADSISFGYGDNDVGYGVATVPTNPVYGHAQNSILYSKVVGTVVETPLSLDVPATKYPFSQGGASGACFGTYFGYEI